MPSKSIVVASDDPEKMGMLRHLLEGDGFQAIPLFIPRLSRGEDQFGDFLAQHKPDIVWYEIGHPYQENWELFTQLRKVDQAKGVDFIVTSLGKNQLETALGEKEVSDVMNLSDPWEIANAVSQRLSETGGEQHFAVRRERGRGY